MENATSKVPGTETFKKVTDDEFKSMCNERGFVFLLNKEGVIEAHNDGTFVGAFDPVSKDCFFLIAGNKLQEFFEIKEDFEIACIQAGFEIQDQGNGVVRAFYEEEYMGAYSENCNEGFLLIERMSKLRGRILH